MAKGNLFLGTAAKSVGDVVMYRREGAQVSRVRVRKIANPKTDAQCKQRAIMAPIPKFFSPLAIVLERSFEGLSKSKSYSKFLKVNADKARANDWLLPKGLGFFPLPYELSQGSLPQLAQVYDAEHSGIKFNGIIGGSGTVTVASLSSALVALGYQNGDVVTFIVVTGDASNLNGSFAPIANQFVIDTTSTADIAVLLPNIVFTSNAEYTTFKNKSGNTVAGAMIIARFENEKWRRSTQSLVVNTTIMTNIADTDYKAAAIASYSNMATEPNPLVYLDGEELQ